jgi:hypothetical protein
LLGTLYIDSQKFAALDDARSQILCLPLFHPCTAVRHAACRQRKRLAGICGLSSSICFNPHHCQAPVRINSINADIERKARAFLVLQRWSLCHRRCTVRLQEETISIMPYCSLQMHGQSPGSVLPGKLCQGLDTRRFVGKTFCLSCMLSAATPVHARLYFGRLPVRGNMKHQVLMRGRLAVGTHCGVAHRMRAVVPESFDCDRGSD